MKLSVRGLLRHSTCPARISAGVLLVAFALGPVAGVRATRAATIGHNASASPTWVHTEDITDGANWTFSGDGGTAVMQPSSADESNQLTVYHFDSGGWTADRAVYSGIELFVSVGSPGC